MDKLYVKIKILAEDYNDEDYHDIGLKSPYHSCKKNVNPVHNHRLAKRMWNIISDWIGLDAS